MFGKYANWYDYENCFEVFYYEFCEFFIVLTKWQ